jgi:hypothetical protein
MEYRTRGRVSIASSGIRINPIPSPLLHIGWSMHSFRVEFEKSDLKWTGSRMLDRSTAQAFLVPDFPYKKLHFMLKIPCAASKCQ